MPSSTARSATSLAVLRQAGGEPGDIGRFTIYVTDMAQYRASLKPLGEAYRRRMGTHYPAMALVEVTSLVDPRGGGRDRGDRDPRPMTLAPRSFLYAVDPATAVATITLNRPDRLNALTFEVYTELRDTFRALDTEPGVRAIIITGTGRAFCSGGDVEDIIGALFARDAAGLLEFTRLTGDLILSIRQCRRPVVAALNGTVAGAGAVIAAASDIRIAAESAKIAFLFSRVGLTGADMGAAWLLPRIVGLAHASELLLLGDFISAERAAAIGLYNRVVPARAADGGGDRGRRPAGAGAVGGARRHQAGAQRGGGDGPGLRDRVGGPGAGRLHAAPELPRGLRGLPRQARAEVRVAHARHATDPRPSSSRSTRRSPSGARRFAMAEIATARRSRRTMPRPGREARALLGLLGAGGWLQPIFDLDLRGCCLTREALGEASPLADAVFALQALGTTPILLAGTPAQKERWLGPIAAGEVMTAFAMTEPEAGSDVAAHRDHRPGARRSATCSTAARR